MNALSELFRPEIDLDMFIDWKPQVESGASFYSGICMVTRTVRVMGAGIWRAAEVERYFMDQRPIIEEARRRFRALRVFFDVRQWVVENDESATQFQGVNGELYRAEDRLVAVVSSSAFKQYPRTALNVGCPEAFISMSAAETWLQAYASVSHAA